MKQEIRAIVTDIEGTTSSLAFVKDTLFPYAYKKIPDYVWDNQEALASLISDIREEERNPDLSLEEVIEVLLRYIEDDEKVTALKSIQGMIWRDGYEAGELEGHIYDDAVSGLKRWKDQDVDLYVYSSGSVEAQKLLFGNTPAGDLTPMFSGYYDTTTGNKKEVESYQKIIEDIGHDANDILFLSDSLEEIHAASEAGMNVIVLDRDGSVHDALGHTVVDSFDEILKETVDA